MDTILLYLLLTKKAHFTDCGYSKKKVKEIMLSAAKACFSMSNEQRISFDDQILKDVAKMQKIMKIAREEIDWYNK